MQHTCVVCLLPRQTKGFSTLIASSLGLAAFTRENGLQGAVFGATREQAERRTPSARLPPGAPPRYDYCT